MNRIELANQLRYMLASTEANALIVGWNECAQTFHALPCWEAESETQVQDLALINAIAWADADGMGDVCVVYGFRDDSNQI